MTQAISRRDFTKFLGCSSLATTASAQTLLANYANGQTQKPNVVLIFADDMGYGDLGCYGHPTIKTPRLDQMAREGLRLTSFYTAAPVCTPSRAALMTGRYPVRAGQPGNLGPGSESGLPLPEVLLPELLQEQGYRTAAIGKWHLGHTPEYLPTSRGFDHYFGLHYSNDMIPPWVQTDKPMHLYRNSEIVEEHPVHQDTLTSRYTEEAINFIKESNGEPFFVYLPHSMPHLPISTPDQFDDTSRAGKYGDTIESIDWSVGQILDTLKEEGVDDNTIVIFTSDNGPWLNLPNRMLAGGVERWHSGFKGLLKGAKGTTYEGGMRVPGIIRWPNVIPEGSTSADIACTMDLFATILAIAGAQPPEDKVIDGKNILPFLKGEESSPRDEFFYCRGEMMEAVRQGPWKLRLSRHLRDIGKDEPLTAELYHLDRDPAEQYNMADRHPEIVQRLEERMKEMAEEIRAVMHDRKLDVDG